MRDFGEELSLIEEKYSGKEGISSPEIIEEDMLLMKTYEEISPGLSCSPKFVHLRDKLKKLYESLFSSLLTEKDEVKDEGEEQDPATEGEDTGEEDTSGEEATEEDTEGGEEDDLGDDSDFEDYEEDAEDTGAEDVDDLPDLQEDGEDPDKDPALIFNTDAPSKENLSGDQSQFLDMYPTVDADETLVSVYNSWVQQVKGKPFVKTIRVYYEQLQAASLDFYEREFLWKFAKAISSAITHLLIEGEQKVEAVILVEKYYDSLVVCMNRVLHASDTEDIKEVLLYMAEFLSLIEEGGSSEAEEDY